MTDSDDEVYEKYLRILEDSKKEDVEEVPIKIKDEDEDR